MKDLARNVIRDMKGNWETAINNKQLEFRRKSEIMFIKRR